MCSKGCWILSPTSTGETGDTNEIERKRQNARNKAINKELESAKDEHRSTHRILLLGAGESGKSTVVKQMKILHVKGYDNSERIAKRLDIKKNVRDAIFAIIEAVEKFGIQYKNEDVNNQALYIKSICTRIENLEKDVNYCLSEQDIPDEFYHAAKIVWDSVEAQAVYKRSNEFQLIDCAKYFLDQVDIIANPNYIPGDQHILRCRVWTYGIFETKFAMDKVKFHMFDVGGQRDQRRKWIQCFNDVTATIFVVACSSYDMTLREDPNQNRLRESLELFYSIWNNRWLRNISSILFLNKQDILEEKITADIPGKKLEDYFPEFATYSHAEERSNINNSANINTNDNINNISSNYHCNSISSNVNTGQENIGDKFNRAKYFIRDEFIKISKRVYTCSSFLLHSFHMCYRY